MSVEQMQIENRLATVSQSSAVARSPAKAQEVTQRADLEKPVATTALSELNKAANLTQHLKQKQDEQAKAEEQQEIDKVQVEQDVQSLNDLFPLKNTNLIFEFDKLGEPPVIKVVDQSNKEVIREIPPKDLAKLSKALQDLADSYSKTGALFNSEV